VDLKPRPGGSSQILLAREVLHGWGSAQRNATRPHRDRASRLRADRVRRLRSAWRDHHVSREYLL